MSFVSKIFGDANERFLKQLRTNVADVSILEAEIQALTDEQLRAKTSDLKDTVHKATKQQLAEHDAMALRVKETAAEEERNRLKKELIHFANQPLDAVLPEAFALVREAARRTLSQRHFDVQLMGGIVLHQGQVAEMKTGEGKTLTSTLTMYLNALTGKGVHLVTVNDYLAKRDAVWMGQIFDFLGLSVGIISHETAFLYDPSHTTPAEDAERDLGVKIEMDFLRPVTRKEAYAADITYGTNNEFGFDYLRDNMVYSLAEKVQRPLNYAIIDEVDSILIDEARTPLIISAPDIESTDKYFTFANIVKNLEETADYTVDEKLKAASLTEQGIAKIEKELGVENIYVEEGIATVHHIEQALKARTLFIRDKDYTVKDGAVLIVDEFTGRILQGRRYSEGLHQAIEAKEGVKVERESKTMATITFQNYFRLYEKIAGMTGTAETEAEELAKIYNLDVTTIPTNKPMIREDLQDRIYKTEEGKYKAVVQEIKALHEKGQPVLVGTISIEKNEYLGKLLELEGLPFNMLNAKQHEREAEVIAQAGAKGAVSIATNMAGRGVDIKLGGLPFNDTTWKEIVNLKGLHVLGTERHESRRIDNQLRGRSGRQGEPGSTQFYVSLEDDLMRIFGADRVKAVMKSWPDDMPIENSFISKSIESAQKRVEGHNFDIRKHLVEYDDVINRQRTIIYNFRNEVIDYVESDPAKLIDKAREEVKNEIEDLVDFHTRAENRKDWDSAKLIELLKGLFGMSDTDAKTIKETIASTDKSDDIAHGSVKTLATERGMHAFEHLLDYIEKNLKNEQHPNPAAEIIKMIYLRTIDTLWVEHLETINYLRTGIGLRGYGQRDPLVEYKRESKDLFTAMLGAIRKDVANSVFRVTVGQPTAPVADAQPHRHLHEHKSTVQAFGEEDKNKPTPAITSKPRDEEGHKIGRNDPCFCGAINPETGEVYKYKKCGMINAPYHKK